MTDTKQWSNAASSEKTGNGAEDWPSSWQTLPHGLRTGRFTDPGFARLEHEKLWSRVWQAAARVDEVLEIGDYTVYDIGDQSIMIVRVDEETVKAYHNACPHRGTTLAENSGNFEKNNIICPYHGWRWDLTGQVQYVLERHEFQDGQLNDSDVALLEVSVELFAGWVFINMDPDAEPFDDFIAPVRELLEDLNVDKAHNYWWKELPVPSNWKVAQEAFLEVFHVPATHPQLEIIGAERIYGGRVDGDFRHTDMVLETFPNGHGTFYGKKGPMKGDLQDKDPTDDPLEGMIEDLQLLVDGMDAMILQENVEVLKTLRGKPIPEGSNLGAEYVKALYADAAEKQKPMPEPRPDLIERWGGEVFIFPNLLILTHAGNAMMYRVKPVGFEAEKCTFEIFSTKPYPAAETPPRPVVQKVTDPADPEQVLLIPRQDVGNIPRVQKGLRSQELRQVWLAEYHEQVIMNMHKELDRYLQS